MISYIQGKVLERKASALLILAGGLGYEVLVPPAILANLPEADEGSEVSLVIYYYLQIDQSRAMPVMIGFRETWEREFFEEFIRVASIGPRTAVKAIAMPIVKIAAAIESGGYAPAHRAARRGPAESEGDHRQAARQNAPLCAVCRHGNRRHAGLRLDFRTRVGRGSAGRAAATPIYAQRCPADDQTRAGCHPHPTSTEEMLEVIYRKGSR